MGTFERRWSILKLLCKERHTTIGYLAHHFNVSQRTISRDIDELSLFEPIYTNAGRYNGGVFILDGYVIGSNYFNQKQKAVIQKVIEAAEDKAICIFEEQEIAMLKEMLITYSKPSPK